MSARIKLCPACAEPLILAPYVVCCSNPRCPSDPRFTSPKPASDVDVKLSFVMPSQKHDGDSEWANSVCERAT